LFFTHKIFYDIEGFAIIVLYGYPESPSYKKKIIEFDHICQKNCYKASKITFSQFIENANSPFEYSLGLSG